VARVELPQDEDGLLPARQEVGAVGGKGEGRHGVRVPVQDARRRGGRRLVAGGGGEDVVPEADLAALVARGKVRVGRVEGDGREALVVGGGDRLGEAALDVGRAREVDGVWGDAREDGAVGREGEGAHDARGREADAARGLDGRGRVGGRHEAVDEVLGGAERDEVDARLGVEGRVGAEGDKEVVGEVGVGRGVEDRGAEVEGAEEGAVEVVPQADLAVGGGDDELARVRGRQEDGRDGGTAQGGGLVGRGRGRGGRGRVGADREGRHELGRGDRVDLYGCARGDEGVAACVGVQGQPTRAREGQGEAKAVLLTSHPG